MKFFLASLVLAHACVALPSYPRRDVTSGNSTTSVTSTTSQTATSSTSSSSATATSTSNTTVSLAELLGIALLSADDAMFIESGEIMLQAGLDAGLNSTTAGKVQSRDFSGPNTPEKWTNNNMDSWLDAYAKTTMISAGSGKAYLLADSTDFVKDFWYSTGEESTFLCYDLLGSCTPTNDPPNARKDLNPDDRQRALFVRQAIVVWQSDLKRSYSLLSDVSNGMQLAITDIRTTFATADAPKPGNPADTLMAILAVVGVLFPATAPAVGLISGAYALGSALQARNEDDIDSALGPVPVSTIMPTGLDDETLMYPRQVTGVADPGSPNGGSASSPSKPGSAGPAPVNPVPAVAAGRAYSVVDASPAVSLVSLPVEPTAPPSKTDTVATVQDRIAALEKEVFKPKDPNEGLKAGLKKTGDILDKAAKVVTAWKNMQPKIAKLGDPTWTSFDDTTKAVFDTFWKSVSQSFTVNKVTFYPKISTTDTNAQVGAQGMQRILANGAWSKGETQSGDIGTIRDNLSDFYKKMVAMQVFQFQSVYLWKQWFESSEKCDTALGQYKDELLVGEKLNQCVKTASGYELQIARRPFTSGAGKGMDFFQSYPSPDSKWIKLGQDETPDADHDTTVFMSLAGQKGSAAIPSWKDDLFTKIKSSTQDIFAASEACQQARGNPFMKDTPSRIDFYPSMSLANFDPNNLNNINQNAQCLFNLPVLNINDPQVAQWCSSNVGAGDSNQPIFSKWKASNAVCVSWDEWAALGDSHVCLDATGPYRSRTAQPGCQAHDRGFISPIKPCTGGWCMGAAMPDPGSSWN